MEKSTIKAKKSWQKTIRQIQSGDLDKFTLLYREYADKIYKFIYYKTMDTEAAQDLTSQTFLNALNAIQKFDSSKGTFQAWIYRIARNQVIDYYRSQKNEANIEDVWDMNDGSDLPGQTDAKATIAAVKKEMQKLSSKQREIILLRIWQGLSFDEIAASLGISQGACKMNFYRGIDKIKGNLSGAITLVLLLEILLWTNK